jgi:hypothetical protein
VTTKAWLEGHPFDLEDLAALLRDGETRVVRDEAENAYYLTSPEIDNPAEPGRFDIPAKQLIDRINGFGRTKSADFRPVKLAGRYTSPTATHIHVGAAAGEIRIRGHAAGVVTTSDGKIGPNPPSPWPTRFAFAATNPDVGEVLDIMGQTEPLGWVELYKVHEIIRHSIMPRKICKIGWATKTKDSAFTVSADRADVSGPDARHARNRTARPRHTMSLAEGRSYMSDLVTKWLASLAGN